jgi:ParB family transcriptional regulator, chromosome partitioning protein
LPLEGALQILSANQVVARKLSVRETEKIVARAATNGGRQQPPPRAKPAKPRELLRIEQTLSDALTAAVEIRVRKRTRRGEQGEVAIAFGSLDELNGLLDKLGLGAA